MPRSIPMLALAAAVGFVPLLALAGAPHGGTPPRTAVRGEGGGGPVNPRVARSPGDPDGGGEARARPAADPPPILRGGGGGTATRPKSDPPPIVRSGTHADADPPPILRGSGGGGSHRPDAVGANGAGGPPILVGKGKPN